MNYTMVKRLILKDWYFQRWPIVGLLALGVMAILLMAAGGSGAFYLGSVLLLTVLITTGILLPVTTVIGEHKGQTLAFVMSLPVSVREYTVAKILANLLIFLIPFLALAVGAMTLFLLGGAGGLIPFSTIVLAELLASYCLLLSVALISGSEGWTIGVMAVTNLFFQGFLYYLAHIPSIANTMSGHTIIWNRTEVFLLMGELTLTLILLVVTFVLQERKTGFL
jgi:ABC-2 type transport system permease protein